jgi:hypothetical protein
MMKRTQMHLDEDTLRFLTAESRRRKTTVSALVREAIAATYGRGNGENRSATIRRLAGVWKGRRDLRDAQGFVRRLRSSDRTDRWAKESR